jgi:hypothetical protein
LDRLKELKANYKYERGDKPVSKNFQRVYNIVVPLLVSAIFGIIIFFIVHAVLFFLPPEYPLIITIVLASLLPISIFKKQLYDDSWKNAILVKKANVPFGTIGGYEFRFRKNSTMAATWRKMAMDYVDKDGDGKVTFQEVLRATGEINIPNEEKEKLRLRFERLDVDKDGFVKAKDALRALNEESITCKVCSKEFEPDMGTREFEFEICGETEDCKNKLWKLGKT